MRACKPLYQIRHIKDQILLCNTVEREQHQLPESSLTDDGEVTCPTAGVEADSEEESELLIADLTLLDVPIESSDSINPFRWIRGRSSAEPKSQIPMLLDASPTTTRRVDRPDGNKANNTCCTTSVRDQHNDVGMHV